VNTPERGESGYSEAKNYIKDQCLYQVVSVDVDDAKPKDKYGRTLAVVYIGDLNLNQQLLIKGYAEIMYIPPSEFNPYTW
jgi:micrococcal nuclease